MARETGLEPATSGVTGREKIQSFQWYLELCAQNSSLWRITKGSNHPTEGPKKLRSLYLLGEENRIVGVSAYEVRPPQVRREKLRVSASTSADVPKILALDPDLILTFSDRR